MMNFLRPTLRAFRFNFSRRQRRLATSSQAVHIKQQPISDNFVEITDVGPRDGLQNEEKIISLSTKIELIEKLALTGLKRIEVGSFVSAKWVPQMADSSEILQHILRVPSNSQKSLTYSFLVPNQRGLENALNILESHKSSQTLTQDKPSFEVNIFVSASETFSQKNLNCSIEASLAGLQPVIASARFANLGVRAYISVVFGCPFEGHVSPSTVASLATKLLSMGATEIDLGDTTGMGTASSTMELLRTLNSAGISNEILTMHFHDTYGMALVNTAVSLEHGIRKFDGSVAGLGGCPYCPGATGNIGTEDLVFFCQTLGMETGVDLQKLVEVGGWIGKALGKTNGSRVGKAILSRKYGN